MCYIGRFKAEVEGLLIRYLAKYWLNTLHLGLMSAIGREQALSYTKPRNRFSGTWR